MKQYQLVMVFLTILFLSASKILAAEEGFLTVITEPSGVEIWLGNNYIGNSPVNSKLVPSGIYEIKLIDPIQKISLSEQIVVNTGKTVVIEKKITPKYGALKVNSVPENSDVYLTVPLGKTPLSSDFIVPGKYVVEIRNSDKLYKPVEKHVVINEGASVVLYDTLSKEAIETLEIEKKKLFDTKAFFRLAFGAGAVASFVWAVVENHNNHYFANKGSMDRAKHAVIRRNIGVISGSVCVVAFEIIAFF